MSKSIALISAFAAIAALPATASADPAQARQGAAATPTAAAPDATQSMIIARIGGSMSPNAGLRGGPEAGLGVRVDMGRVGIDLSTNLGLNQRGARMDVTGLRGSFLKLSTHYHFMPDATSSPYVGGGLSVGGQSDRIMNRKVSGMGLQGEIVLGYELMRRSSVGLFIELGATLPMYVAKSACPVAPERRYMPTMGLSIGVALGGKSAK